MHFNDRQVYRSYRGDVTMLTDLVRCAVLFETPEDMFDFVKRWLFVLGEPKRLVKEPSALMRWKKNFQELVNVLRKEFFGSQSAWAASERRQCTEDAKPGKCFEILRIRNRLDPALQDVMGGYRDLALKLKIAFIR